MCVNGDISPGILVEMELLIRVFEIQLAEGCPSSQRGKQAVHARQVGVDLGGLVHGQFVVTTDPYCTISLDHGDNGFWLPAASNFSKA